jgi:hypothetical protein
MPCQIKTSALLSALGREKNDFTFFPVCPECQAGLGVTAFIYMDGSPSCGVYRTTLKNTKRGNPPGVFGSLLLDEGFFLIPSSDLQSPLKWWDWRRRLLAFHWFTNHPLYSMQELYETWYVLKFLCQELDNTWAREMGRTPASLSKNDFAQFEPTFRSQILDLLRRPSTTARRRERRSKRSTAPISSAMSPPSPRS